MQSLRYTNFLLTIIAVCLVYQCAKFGSLPSIAASATQPSFKAASQTSQPVNVRIVGTPTVNVEGVVSTRTTIDGTPSVNISQPSNDALARELASSFENHIMSVKVTNQPADSGNGSYGNSFNRSNPLPVELVNQNSIHLDYSASNPLPVQLSESRPISVKNTGTDHFNVRVINEKVPIPVEIKSSSVLPVEVKNK